MVKNEDIGNFIEITKISNSRGIDFNEFCNFCEGRAMQLKAKDALVFGNDFLFPQSNSKMSGNKKRRYVDVDKLEDAIKRADKSN